MVDYGTTATREHAFDLVRNLTGDERVREKLAQRCWAEAEHRWVMLGGAAAMKAS